jgi:ferric-dicitrate binding protein FerR (iron transport regulator)
MTRNRTPALVQQAAESPRRAQLRRFRRNQLLGVLLVAAAILLAALLRTNPRWIFPPGWWRP